MSKEEQALAVPTSERLHHAGGESLRTNMEVTLEVDISGTVFDVTFNVIESGRFPLGFLLGMDVLEKHDFVLNAATRQVEFRRVPLPQDELNENRAFREKELTSVGTSVAACLPLDDDFEDPGPRLGQGVSVRVVRAVVLDVQTEVPAFTKQMLKAVFPSKEEDDDLDLSTESWVFLPLDAVDERFEKLRGLTLWPGLSKVVTEEEPRPKFQGASAVFSLPVHVVNASSRPRVLKAKTVLGHVHSKPKLTGCDTYLLKDVRHVPAPFQQVRVR